MHGEVRERLESEIKKVDKKIEKVSKSIKEEKVSDVLYKEAVTTRTTVGRLSAMRNDHFQNSDRGHEIFLIFFTFYFVILLV